MAEERPRAFGPLDAFDTAATNVGSLLQQLQQMQESFVITYQSMVKIDSLYQNAVVHASQMQNDPNAVSQLQSITQQKAQMEQRISNDAGHLLLGRQQVNQQLLECLPNLASELDNFILRRDAWVAEQRSQMASDEELATELDKLQDFANELTGVIWALRQHLRTLCFLQTQLPLGGSEPNAQHSLSQFSTLLNRLLHSAFIVEQQPPQVLKTQTRFAAAARFLVGSKLNLHMDPPEVTVSIVNERQSTQIRQESEAYINGQQINGPQRTASGEIVNGARAMSHQQLGGRGVYTATFKSMSLRKIKRSEKGENSDQVVTEEKFALVFSFTLHMQGLESIQRVCTMSNPLVVIVHGNQQPNAEATVMWDNAFAIPQRMGFECEPATSWLSLMRELSKYHKRVVGSELAEEHIKFLSQVVGADSQERSISWQKFNKELLPERGFTFWEWFHGACETSRRHMLPLWQDGLVHGYVSKEDAQDMLMGSSVGNFMMRFSASLVGGVSISWCTVDEEGRKQVLHLQPWSGKDFNIRSLPDRIKDLGQLQYLYPDRPKEECFGRHYKADEPQPSGHLNGGYVMSDIAVILKQSPQRGDASAYERTYVPFAEALRHSGRPEASGGNPPDDDTAMAASVLQTFAGGTQAKRNPANVDDDGMES